MVSDFKRNIEFNVKVFPLRSFKERSPPRSKTSGWRGGITSLGLDGSEGLGAWDDSVNAGEPVLITLGGGHYAPRGNLTAAESGVWLGHMLATYALPFDSQPEDGQEATGFWRQSITAAYRSTQRAFPNGNLVFSMDEKAFKGWQRQAIRDHLEVLGAPLLKRQGVLELAKRSSSTK